MRFAPPRVPAIEACDSGMIVGIEVISEEYLKVCSLDPAPPPSLHVNLAAVYLKEAAGHKAYVELQAYLRAAPDGPLATKVREEMKRMEAASATLPTQANATQSPPAKP